jgi:glycosyltransferase involved in cell wall biosynthesis
MLWLWAGFGGVLAVVWWSRAIDAGLGMPSVAEISTPEWDRRLSDEPRVTIVVPARNEQECIQKCLESLLALEYENFEVIAVNDRSTDLTGQLVDKLAESHPGGKLSVIHVQELPPGWLGKTHAMWLAGQRATGDYILFTDGDVIFRQDSLRRAISYAVATSADHLVLYPTVSMHTFGERMMIVFFQIMFVFGHRAWKVADPKARDHIGVGAFNLIRRSAYEAIGTYRSLRMNVIDDINLGRLVKKHGFSQRNVFGKDLIVLRWAKGALGVVGNLDKNFFALLRFNVAIVLIAVIGMTVLNLGPFLGTWLAPGWAKSGFIASLVALATLYVGIAGKSQTSPLYFFAHPLSSCLFIYTMVRSSFLTLKNKGVIWRGTRYPLDELKQNL